MYPADSVSQVSENFMDVDDESDGDTDGDVKKSEAFLQFRKSKRDFKRKTGQPLKHRGRKSSPPGNKGGGFQPWWGKDGDGAKPQPAGRAVQRQGAGFGSLSSSLLEPAAPAAVGEAQQALQ